MKINKKTLYEVDLTDNDITQAGYDGGISIEVDGVTEIRIKKKGF